VNLRKKITVAIYRLHMSITTLTIKLFWVREVEIQDKLAKEPRKGGHSSEMDPRSSWKIKTQICHLM